MQILLSPKFIKQLKRLHPNEKRFLDRAVKKISEDVEIGDPKVGDLENIFVYKFKMKDQQWLLAYRVISKKTLKLILMGPHENFYRDLKKN